MPAKKKLFISLGLGSILTMPAILAVSCGSGGESTGQLGDIEIPLEEDKDGEETQDPMEALGDVADEFKQEYKISSTILDSSNNVIGVFYFLFTKENEIKNIYYYTEDTSITDSELTTYFVTAVDKIISTTPNKPYVSVINDFKSSISTRVNEIHVITPTMTPVSTTDGNQEESIIQEPQVTAGEPVVLAPTVVEDNSIDPTPLEDTAVDLSQRYDELDQTEQFRDEWQTEAQSIPMTDLEDTVIVDEPDPIPVPPAIPTPPSFNPTPQPTPAPVDTSNIVSTPEEDQAMIAEIQSWPELVRGAKLPADLDRFTYGPGAHMDPVRGVPVDDSAFAMIRAAQGAVTRGENTVAQLTPEYNAAVEAMTRASGSVEAYIAKINEINNEFLHPTAGIVEGHQSRPTGLVDDGEITYTMKTSVAGRGHERGTSFTAHKWHDDTYEYIVSTDNMTKQHLTPRQIQTRITKLESTLLKSPVHQLIESNYGHKMSLVWYPDGGGGASHGGEEEVAMSTEVPGDRGATEILYHEIGHGLFKASPLGMIGIDKRYEMTMAKMRACGFDNLADEIDEMRNAPRSANYGDPAIVAHKYSPWMFSYTEENTHLVDGAPQYPQYEENFKNAIAYFNQWPNVNIPESTTSLPRISVEEYGMSFEEVLTRLLLQTTWVNPDEQYPFIGSDGNLSTWNEAFNEMVMIKIWANDSFFDETGHLKMEGKDFLAYTLGRNNPLFSTASFSGTDFTKLQIVSGTDYDHIKIKWLGKAVTTYSTKETFSGNIQFKDTFSTYSNEVYNYNIYKQVITIDADHRGKSNWNQESGLHRFTEHAEIEFWKDAAETEKVPASDLVLNGGIQIDPATGKMYIR